LKSYTDCRGPEIYNQYLSDLRATESVDYIQQRISKPMRISGKGFGESNPLNKCECEDEVISTCTAKEHQQNRRTEFIVVKM
jgi:outer membrane protein OmpA-like peptidoglycan-associated protein